MEFTRNQIVKNLEKMGLTFRSFDLSSEGRYSPKDADWNYKDVPHLAVVHQLVDSVFASVGDDKIATINVQKMLGLRFPMSVYNYQPKNGNQTYYSTLFFYALIIETACTEIAPNQTRVTTTYTIGSSKFWMMFFPVLAWMLRRNYKDLMSTDIPMRLRRGQLRDWGYKFKYDDEPCTFIGTMDISKTNLASTAVAQAAPSTFELPLNDLRNKKEVFLGRADHMGVRCVLIEDEVSIYPRLCPHEGANLDDSPCEGGRVKCPWHNRPFTALAKFKMGESGRLDLKTGSLEFSPTSLKYSAVNWV